MQGRLATLERELATANDDHQRCQRRAAQAQSAVRRHVYARAQQHFRCDAPQAANAQSACAGAAAAASAAAESMQQAAAALLGRVDTAARAMHARLDALAQQLCRVQEAQRAARGAERLKRLHQQQRWRAAVEVRCMYSPQTLEPPCVGAQAAARSSACSCTGARCGNGTRSLGCRAGGAAGSLGSRDLFTQGGTGGGSGTA